jgi:hypothetical protein
VKNQVLTFNYADKDAKKASKLASPFVSKLSIHKFGEKVKFSTKGEKEEFDFLKMKF